jgi:catechol 2,3-dioxygenase
MTTAISAHLPAPGTRLADATTLGGVELAVTSLERSIDFYTRVIGLSLDGRGADRAVLVATPGTPLVTLREDPLAQPPGRHAGLYHFALLFESRRELARAGRRVAETRTPIDGASDHTTHEAIYLPDPDGIGVELAADRPRERWPNLSRPDAYAHGPMPLDIPDLFSTIAGEPYPEHAGSGLRMGHIHLHVGDLEASMRFYRDGLGFAVRTQMPHAVFVSVGGYHHHVAFNLWRGTGVAAAAASGVCGLRHWTLQTADGGELDALATRLAAQDARLVGHDGGLLARDPSGIAVLIR